MTVVYATTSGEQRAFLSAIMRSNSSAWPLFPSLQRLFRKYAVRENIRHTAQLRHSVEKDVQSLVCPLCFTKALEKVADDDGIDSQACLEDLAEEGQR
jgi:hypothetical protein